MVFDQNRLKRCVISLACSSKRPCVAARCSGDVSSRMAGAPSVSDSSRAARVTMSPIALSCTRLEPRWMDAAWSASACLDEEGGDE